MKTGQRRELTWNPVEGALHIHQAAFLELTLHMQTVSESLWFLLLSVIIIQNVQD